MINPHDIMDYDITGYKSPTLHLGGKPDSEVYSRAYDLPVPSTYSFDLTAENLPEGIRLYNHNWSILAGKITSPDIWKDYQDYYLNCIQDNDNNLMNVIDLQYPYSKQINIAVRRSALPKTDIYSTVTEPFAGWQDTFALDA